MRWKKRACWYADRSCRHTVMRWSDRINGSWKQKSTKRQDVNLISIRRSSWERFCLKSWSCQRAERKPKPDILPLQTFWKMAPQRQSDCCGYPGIPGADEIEIDLCGRSGGLYRGGRAESTRILNQTITATGRISSTEPNLQNIPMRTELGRLIRKVFVPKDNYLFTDADYSQIELRVLAHISGDEAADRGLQK